MLRLLKKYGMAVGFICISAWTWAEGGSAKDAGFEVALSLENGHLGQVIFGLSPQATAGFDRECDSPAPPPGHGTGYTAFLLEESDMPLYRDFKSLAARVTWTFLGRVHPNKPIRIHWQADALPEGYEMRVRHPGQAQPLDMRKTTALTLEHTAKIQFIAILKNHADPAEETVNP